MHIEWWIWVVFGILLLLTELMTPGGFYLLFLGVAAIVTGMLTPLAPRAWVETLLFAVLSIGFIAILRKPLARRVKQSTPKADVQEFIGETARAFEPIQSGSFGSVELRGSTWRAKNSGEITIERDGQCTIVSRDGLTLHVTVK